MAELSFPLENTTYTAKEAAIWFATRGSGVYADNHLAVSAGSGMAISVGEGMAWLAYAKYAGVAYLNDAAKTLMIGPADAKNDRIDRVVVRYSRTSNSVQMAVLAGASSASPVAPALTRTDETYEISLAQIYVRAGSTSITAGSITDERLNESVCGLMRDSVNSIPTDGLYAKVASVIREPLKNELTIFINSEIAKKEQLKPEFANSVAECTDTSKLYVLPDGYIYAYMVSISGQPKITYEGKTGGFWYANEYHPLGFEDTLETTCGKRTNVIAVTPGDQLRYRGFASSTPDSVVWLDANKAFLSDEKHDALVTPVIVTAPENAAYVWFASYDYTPNVDNIVLDVQWVRCQAATAETRWTSTGHAFVPADYENRIIDLEMAVKVLKDDTTDAVADVLTGKKIVYDGDSIAESRLGDNYNGGGYAKIIADMVDGEYVNQAVGGARLAAHSERHSVVNNLSNLPKDGDLYCFEGGINDFWDNTAIGELTAGYDDELDPSTICGAMETILRHCLTNLLGKPVCFVITHKVQNTATSKNGNGDTFQDYRDAMISACEKYSIPYYDAFSKSGLNGWNTAQSNAYLTANATGSGDGTHPNEAGYRRYYVPQLLALFRTMIA